MDEIISFGVWVQQRRKALDLTQAELAGRIGCAAVTIKKIEQDERRPSRQMADLLADHLLIPSLERDAFLRRARGQFVPLPSSSAAAIPLPAFLKSGDLSGPQPSLPFVGRERELAQLQAHLNAVLAGEGRVVFITGEAGEGKTTLMAEFARRAQAAHPDLIVAGGLCNAFAGAGDPYLPFRDIFSLLTGDLEPRRAAGLFSAEQARRLWQFLPRTIQALAEHGPDLMNVLVSTAALAERIAAHGPAGAGWLNSLQVLIEAPGLANLEQRQRFEQVTLVLRALAAAQPLLLLLDDLQWADSASLNLLFHLGRRLPGSRILILAAYRASEASVGGAAGSPAALLERVVNELKRHFGDIQLDLEQFNPAEERAFVDALLDREPNHLGPAFRETLFWRTKGHPLFTVELLRDLQERGNLARDEAGCWVEGAALDWKTLPVRVEAVIKQRIDRLDAGLQELLAIASVEGERFTAQVVALAERLSAEDVMIHALNNIGASYMRSRDWEQGLAMLQDSLQRALKMGLPHDACRAYVNLGEGLGWKSRYAEVRTTFEEMLAYATRVHANVFAGVALVRLGELEWQVGQWAAALAWRQRIVDWMDSLPVSTVPRVWASTFLGWLHNDLGQPQAARQILEADLPGARGLAEIQSTVPHLAQLARALAGLGLETETTALVQEFLALVDRTPDAHPANTGPLLFACRWFAARPASADLSPARACLSRLERACAQLGSPDTEAAYREGQAVIALAGSSPAQAVEPFQDAAGRWQALNRPYDRLRTLSGLGRAFQQRGDLRAAQTTFDHARAGVETLAAQLQDPELKTSFLSSPLVQEIQTRALENSKRLRLKPSG